MKFVALIQHEGAGQGVAGDHPGIVDRIGDGAIQVLDIRAGAGTVVEKGDGRVLPDVARAHDDTVVVDVLRGHVRPEIDQCIGGESRGAGYRSQQAYQCQQAPAGTTLLIGLLHD